jgi:hypothetical protein
MKRTTLAVLMVALALVGLAAPAAFAQAPAPKVTINGLIDNLTSYSQNIGDYNGGLFNRSDKMWYGRTRGRFDFIGEMGKAKGVLGIELDHVYGQAGSSDTNFGTGSQSGFGTDGSFDLNTDSRGIIEIKWLYVEFPVPLVPFPATLRLGAQPFGDAANYKLAVYANGDFPGINWQAQVSPNVKLVGTYVQVEEGLVGTQTKTGFPLPSSSGSSSAQNRGNDWAGIFAPEITPFKGLDIKPMISSFYAQGTTSGSARVGRGGLNTTTPYTGPGGVAIGGIEEHRYTVGVDARYRTGPFSLDPTILFQFGSKDMIAPSDACTTGTGASTDGTQFTCSGALPGHKYHPKMSAVLVDVRAGYQLGPMLFQGLFMYTSGNSARNNTIGHGTTNGDIHYFQPIDTDTSYLGDWGTNLTSLGIDYLNAMGEVGTNVGYLGNAIGYDKYGRVQIGAKVTYAITPALSVSANGDAIWTAEAVDRNGIPVSSGGIAPVFNGPRPRDKANFLGTEVNLLLSWQFAPGLRWDNQFGYLFTGKAWDAQTDPALPRNVNQPFMLTSRVRLTF